MSAPMSADIPCCSPATTESVAVVRDKVADSRADLLVGQGAILRSQGDYTAAILRDSAANAGLTNANVDRNNIAAMSQIDKYGLANLNASAAVGDNVTRSGFNGVQATHEQADRLGGQANTIAWNQAGIQNAGFAEARAQTERINDAQSAYSDRSFKQLNAALNDDFARLGAQGENGFYRTGVAVGAVDKQVVESEMNLGRATSAGFADLGRLTSAGFTDIGNNVRESYARLSEQNCQTKETVAAYGNRASDQTATVLATLSGQHAGITRDVGVLGREIALQAATQFAATQLEASKNTGAMLLEASKNAAAAQVEASKNTAALQLQIALNSKESLMEQSKWFALAEKTAMVNKCDLEAKMAACCCEIKETVVGSANATQALIQANEATRARDALQVAATENAILRLRREEHHHYPPPPYYPPYHHGGSRRGSRSSRN
jgi:hypothetical protein